MMTRFLTIALVVVAGCGYLSENFGFGTESVSTETSLTLDGYQNGAPGTVSVSGDVLCGDGSVPTGTVDVNFEQLDGMMTRSTVQQPLENGHYEVWDWPVDAGQWHVSAVFPDQGNYSSSESNEAAFSIQPGAIPPVPTPIPPVTTVTVITVDEVLHGQPGHVTVSGSVQANGNPASGTVTVYFDKDSGARSSAPATLSNGSYTVAYWTVGVGHWNVHAEFVAQGNYTGSVTGPISFEVKSGYRLVNRRSDKCMSLSGNNGANGTAILQWSCSPSPSPGDGQVLTFYPAGGGDLYLKINSTGKCVDVSGASQADGSYLQQWDCLGPGQRNQVWRLIPIDGQPPYFAFQAQHSGRCADVLGGGTNDGVRIGQWGCNWAGNQQWKLQTIQ